MQMSWLMITPTCNTRRNLRAHTRRRRYCMRTGRNRRSIYGGKKRGGVIFPLYSSSHPNHRASCLIYPWNFLCYIWHSPPPPPTGPCYIWGWLISCASSDTLLILTSVCRRAQSWLIHSVEGTHTHKKRTVGGVYIKRVGHLLHHELSHDIWAIQQQQPRHYSCFYKWEKRGGELVCGNKEDPSCRHPAVCCIGKSFYPWHDFPPLFFCQGGRAGGEVDAGREQTSRCAWHVPIYNNKRHPFFFFCSSSLYLRKREGWL